MFFWLSSLDESDEESFFFNVATGVTGFFTGVEGAFAAGVFFFFASSSDESESDELSFFLFADKLAGGGIAAFGITTRQRCSSDDHNVISVPLETAGLLLVAASLSESSLLDETAFFAAGVVGLAGVATGFFLVSSSDESESDELSFFLLLAATAGVGTDGLTVTEADEMHTSC